MDKSGHFIACFIFSIPFCDYNEYYVGIAELSIDKDITDDVNKVITTQWSTRSGTTVPSTESVALNGGAVKLDATYLFADLAHSSKMASQFDKRVTAKILKSFLATSARICRFFGGSIMSFDGDRIMAAYIGGSKNTSAVKAAFGISYAVSEIIRPKFYEKYQTVKDAGFHITHATGIDTGEVLVIRAGARGANDLISIGPPPNMAAKLSDLREYPFTSYISKNVYDYSSDSCKIRLNGNSDVWEQRSWDFLGSFKTIYRSDYWRKPSLW